MRTDDPESRRKASGFGDNEVAYRGMDMGGHKRSAAHHSKKWR